MPKQSGLKLDRRRTMHRFGFSLLELLVVVAILFTLASLILPARRSARPLARSTQCLNHMHHIGLALQLYASSHNGYLPPAYTTDENGRRLHSWRTLLLPYLDYPEVYRKVDLSKPWNDPANAEARRIAISVYNCPSAELAEGYTTFLGLVGDDHAFLPTQPRRLDDIRNGHGTAETVVVLDVAKDHAVHWMSPSDVDGAYFVKLDEHARLQHDSSTHVLFADGAARNIEVHSRTIKQRRTWSTIVGAEESSK